MRWFGSVLRAPEAACYVSHASSGSRCHIILTMLSILAYRLPLKRARKSIDKRTKSKTRAILS